MDWLAVWGVPQAAYFAFRPILENLATDVASDEAKSYVGQCFQNVISAVHKKPLTRATGLALKQLLELLQDELVVSGVNEASLTVWLDDVRAFINREEVKQAIASLYLDPGFRLLPHTFVDAWIRSGASNSLPDNFRWQSVTKRFDRKIAELRESAVELRETYVSHGSADTSVRITETFGLPPDFDLEAYRESLIERFGNLDFAMLDTTGNPDSDTQLWSVFVPQSVREYQDYYPKLLERPKEDAERLLTDGSSHAGLPVQRRDYFDQPLRSVLEVCDDPTIKRKVILGDPGSGKSSLLQFLALRWARIEDANLRFTHALPLLIELRVYNRWKCDSGKSFIRYLHEASTWHRFNQQTLQQLLKRDGKVMLLLDGLDEVFEATDREWLLDDIQRFSNEYPGVGIVVTSRVVGYGPRQLRDAKFHHFILQDLDQQQVESFLHRWHQMTSDGTDEANEKSKRLMDAIRMTKPIALLAGNPLLLTMMAILNRHHELPRDRTQLYQKASEVLLYQWDTERALGEYPELLGQVDFRAKTAILRRLAYTIQTRCHGNIIDSTTLTSLIENYLQKELHFQQPHGAANAVVRQMRERNFIICCLGNDSYAFVHRAFLDYFCAADLVYRFHVEHSIDIQGLIAEFDQHCHDDEWHETLRLICGQIEERFVGRIVNYLRDRKTLAELPLAISCLAETKSPGKLKGVGGALLDDVLGVFASHKCNRHFHERLHEAITGLGTRWPATGDKKVAAAGVEAEFNDSYWAAAFWPPFFAEVFNDRNHIEKMVCNPIWNIRFSAIRVLGERWPDEHSRELIDECARHDQDHFVRAAGIEVLAKNWPDEVTRMFLVDQASNSNEHPHVREVALLVMAKEWADEIMRAFLIKRASEEGHAKVRRTALEALAAKWPDELARRLLIKDAAEDEYASPGAKFRSFAEKWPDATTRKLLTEYAVQDEFFDINSDALRVLAEKWPDQHTRTILTERAKNQYIHYDPRRAALRALFDKWPDETTRTVIGECSIEDVNAHCRIAAIETLVDAWPDTATLSLLEARLADEREEMVLSRIQVLAGILREKLGR